MRIISIIIVGVVLSYFVNQNNELRQDNLMLMQEFQEYRRLNSIFAEKDETICEKLPNIDICYTKFSLNNHCFLVDWEFQEDDFYPGKIVVACPQ